MTTDGARSDMKVLVIDNLPLDLKLMGLLMTAAGCVVRLAGDGLEAPDILATLHPRLILMDARMPGLEGPALTRRPKADPRTADIAIVIVTAYYHDEAAVRAAGCEGVIPKPIDVDLFATQALAHVPGHAS